MDGVVLMEIRLEDDRVTRLTKTGLPIVTIGRIAEPHDMSWIDIDYSGLIARCVRHLADLGHRHVALVNRCAELVAAGYGPSHRALTGFRAAAADRGLTGEENLRQRRVVPQGGQDPVGTDASWPEQYARL
ncbi:hypothetical protein AB0F61_33685, partial [Micromonospora sp. NPDC023888]